MGWLEMQNMGSHSTPKAYLENQYTVRQGHLVQSVLKSATVGRAWYAAIQLLDEDAGTRKVSAAICLFRYKPRARDGYIFGYKDMSESMGPCETQCPESILDLLTETDKEYAIKWRAECREHHARRKLIIKKPKPAQGDIIVFKEKIRFQGGAELDRFRATTLPRRRGLIFQSTETRGYYRVPKFQELDYEIQPAAS